MAITHEDALDQFYRQIDFVLNSYSSCGRNVSQYKNLIIGGLGGSGIGGRIGRLAYYTSFPIPVEVYSEYCLPAYASKDTLVILSSYSGNTEETLSMFEDAVDRGCDIICIASGGELLEKSKQAGYKTYTIESGYQPRQALGYSLTTLLMILGELVNFDARTELQKVSDMLKNNNDMKNTAMSMLEFFKDSIHNKFIVICDYPYEAVSIRFCQQMQENAKLESFTSVLPEANHNMIETYNRKLDANFIMLNSGLNERVNARFEFVKQVLADNDNKVYSCQVKPFDFSNLFETIHFLDWLSIYASDEAGADNMNVAIISRLKTFLDSIQ